MAGAGEDPGKIYLRGNLPPTAVSRPCSADLQSFAIHISCVATPKLAQIYITVSSRRKYGSEPAKQTRAWTEVSGGTDGLCHLHCSQAAPSSGFHSPFNFCGVILQLYWLPTALISWWCFKLLKALSGIMLNLGQKKLGTFWVTPKMSPWVWATSVLDPTEAAAPEVKNCPLEQILKRWLLKSWDSLQSCFQLTFQV